MQWKQPWPNSGIGTDPNAPFQNPGGTIPTAMPGGVPTGYWESGTTALAWTAGSGNPVAFTALWRSPQFDLRPELKAADGMAQTNMQQMWKPGFSAGVTLWVQVSGLLTTSSTVGLRVVARNRCHIFHPNRMQFVDSPQDMSKEFVGLADQPDCILAFNPPGDGQPVRFWQLEMRFDIIDTTILAGPALAIAAAMY